MVILPAAAREQSTSPWRSCLDPHPPASGGIRTLQPSTTLLIPCVTSPLASVRWIRDKDDAVALLMPPNSLYTTSGYSTVSAPSLFPLGAHSGSGKLTALNRPGFARYWTLGQGRPGGNTQSEVCHDTLRCAHRLATQKCNDVGSDRHSTTGGSPNFALVRVAVTMTIGNGQGYRYGEGTARNADSIG